MINLEFEEKSIHQTLKEVIGIDILGKLARGEEVNLEIRKRDMSNVSFDEDKQILVIGDNKSTRRMFSLGEIRTFAQTMIIAESLYKASLDDFHPTLRQVYYRNLKVIPGSKGRKTFDAQEESNSIIQDLELITDLTREQFGIIADPKGQLVGDVQLKSEDDIINGSKMGKMAISVPSIVDDLDLLSTTAEYVLVIEKGAIFEGLKDNKFWDKNNCLLVTGKGFPDRGTRRMVKRLHDEFNLPIYVLVDGDAYGFAIYGVYKHGSVSLAYQNHQLACPEAKFLGVSINDIYNYKIPKTAILQATKADVKRANDMAKNSWFNTPFWKTELELLQKKKEKVELESFAQFGWNYLADTYIPQKIKELNT